MTFVFLPRSDSVTIQQHCTNILKAKEKTMLSNFTLIAFNKAAFDAAAFAVDAAGQWALRRHHKLYQNAQ